VLAALGVARKIATTAIAHDAENFTDPPPCNPEENPTQSLIEDPYRRLISLTQGTGGR
jgi:hypothetical protein